MAIVASGKTLELVVFVVFAVIVLYFILTAGSKTYPLRELAQITAVEGGVDRAVEEGKAVFVSPGSAAQLQGMLAPMSIAGFNVMRYVTRMAVRKGVRPILQIPMDPQSVGLVDGIYRESCVAEGKPEAYRREDVVFAGRNDMSVFSMMAGLSSKLGTSLYCVVGAEYSAGVHVAADMASKGALVVAGTARYAHSGNWAMLADYPLFGDDIYAAGAYCAQNNAVAASIWGSDIMKFILIGALILSVIMAAAGLPIWQKPAGWLYQ